MHGIPQQVDVFIHDRPLKKPFGHGKRRYRWEPVVFVADTPNNFLVTCQQEEGAPEDVDG
jgi:hypothetical protein